MPSGEKSLRGKGDGHGSGPAKGAGRGGPARNPRKAFKKSGEPNVGVALVPAFDGTVAGPGRGKFSIAGEERQARKARWAEMLNEHLMDLAFNAVREETQNSATQAMLSRLEGMPTQRTELTGRGGAPVAIATTDPVEAARAYQQIMIGKG